MKIIYFKIFDKKNRPDKVRMAREIAKYFFNNYPDYPLTSLRTFIDQGYPDLGAAKFEQELNFDQNIANCDDEIFNDFDVSNGIELEMKQEIFDQIDINDNNPLGLHSVSFAHIYSTAKYYYN